MFGVVPGVVPGVVLVVVLGVVPLVVLGVVGTLLVAVGGQTVLEPAVVGEEPGIVALGLALDGLEVLAIGDVEVTGQPADEADRGAVVCMVVDAAGLVVCTPLFEPAELVD